MAAISYIIQNILYFLSIIYLAHLAVQKSVGTIETVKNNGYIIQCFPMFQMFQKFLNHPYKPSYNGDNVTKTQNFIKGSHSAISVLITT